MVIWQQLGKEISDEYRAMGLLPEQVAQERRFRTAQDTIDSDVFGTRGAVGSSLKAYSFPALSKKPSQPTLVVGPDDNPITDTALASQLETTIGRYSNMIAERTEQIELTPEQRLWAERVLAGHGELLKIFGVQYGDLAGPDHVHLISHRDFQRHVPGARQDDESITERAGIIQGAMTAHRQIYIDADQDLEEFLHSLTHEAGHANSRLTVKAHRLPEGDAVVPMSYKRIGLRGHEGNSRNEMRTIYALLDEGVVELFAVLSRVNLYFEHQQELTDALGEDGVENLLVTYSDLNIGLQLILGVIEHMAKSLHTSAIHILITAIQSLNTDSDIFYQMMEKTLSPDFLQAYREGQVDVMMMLAHRYGYVADFPENKPYQNGALEQAIRFMVTRKAQMQIEKLIPTN